MTLATATLTLWLLMDPLGNLPVFGSVLGGVRPERRRRVLARELLLALGFLILFLFVGKGVFRLLELEVNSVRIAGGLILGVMSFRMIFPGDEDMFGGDGEGEPLFFPMAVPLLAGPAVLSLLLLLTSGYPDHTGNWVLAVVGAWAGSALVLMFASKLAHVLGDKGLEALTRLMGMLMACMAVQMLVDGFHALGTPVV
ncbi:MAG: MarC family protein [Planctomycetota bacterium]|nr:MarC family protein [Planctomycetota bacterium]